MDIVDYTIHLLILICIRYSKRGLHPVKEEVSTIAAPTMYHHIPKTGPAPCLLRYHGIVLVFKAPWPMMNSLFHGLLEIRPPPYHSEVRPSLKSATRHQSCLTRQTTNGLGGYMYHNSFWKSLSLHVKSGIYNHVHTARRNHLCIFVMHFIMKWLYYEELNMLSSNYRVEYIQYLLEQCLHSLVVHTTSCTCNHVMIVSVD